MKALCLEITENISKHSEFLLLQYYYKLHVSYEVGHLVGLQTC